MSKYVRRQLLINRRFQYRYILRSLIPVTVFGILASAGLYWGISILERDFSFQDTNGLLLQIAGRFGTNLNSGTVFENLKRIGYLILAVLWLALAIYIVIVFLRYSNRVAGPVYRFERLLVKILKGDLTGRINLRNKDEFRDTASQMNEMVQTLADRVRRIARYSGHLQERLREMELKAGDPEHKKDIEVLKDLASGLDETVRDFKF